MESYGKELIRYEKLKLPEYLKKLYLEVENDMKTNPVDVENNYYEYSEYNQDRKEKELEKKIEELSDPLLLVLDKDIKMIMKVNEGNDENNYMGELNEYLSKLMLENDELLMILKKKRGDILTNDRKTYYEKEALDGLQDWYKLFWRLYYFLILVMMISIFFVPSKFSMWMNVVIFMLLLFYPYYIDYIVRWVYGLYNRISNRIPKNVYNDL